MIDRDARKKLGRLMQNFATGKINNLEFDDAYDDITMRDPAIFSIGYGTFVDFNMYATVRLAGKYRLARQERRMAARWLLFLQTDFEYTDYSLNWHERVRSLLSALTFGLISKGPAVEEYEWHKKHVWPFLSPEQLQEARARPRLLCGQQSA